MELEEKIKKQIAAGFGTDDIKKNLLLDGHSKEEIAAGISQQSKAIRESTRTSPKSIIFGILMIIVVIFRISRASNSHGAVSVLALISVFTGIGLAIYYFTKRS